MSCRRTPTNFAPSSAHLTFFHTHCLLVAQASYDTLAVHCALQISLWAAQLTCSVLELDGAGCVIMPMTEVRELCVLPCINLESLRQLMPLFLAQDRSAWCRQKGSTWHVQSMHMA